MDRERRVFVGFAAVLLLLLVVILVGRAGDDDGSSEVWRVQGNAQLSRGERKAIPIDGTGPFALLVKVERLTGNGPDLLAYAAPEYRALERGDPAAAEEDCTWRGAQSLHTTCELWLGEWVLVFEMNVAPTAVGGAGTFSYEFAAYRGEAPLEPE